MGLGYWAVLMPAGCLLRGSSHTEDRPALCAAQFDRSQPCRLVTHPLAGWLMTAIGAVPATTTLAALVTAGARAALRLWHACGPMEVPERHDGLPPDHPRFAGRRSHSHAYIIDDFHTPWPSRGQGRSTADGSRRRAKTAAPANAGPDLNTLAQRILPLRTISGQMALKVDPARHPASVAGKIFGP